MRRTVHVACLLCAVLLVSRAAQADSVTYVLDKYFDTGDTSPEGAVPESPTQVNNSGVMSLMVEFFESPGGFEGAGLLLLSGGPGFTPIVEFTDTNAFPSAPLVEEFAGHAINDDGVVIFRSFANGLGEGFFAFADGVLSPLPIPSTLVHGRLPPHSFNDNGELVFGGRRDGTRGIFLVTLGGAVTSIAEIGDDWTVLGQPTINDDGVVAFVGQPADADSPSVFVYENGTITPVLESDEESEVLIGTATITNSGSIGALVRLSTGDDAAVILDTQTGDVTVAADTSGPLSGFVGGMNINDNNVVTFVSTLDSGGQGVFSVIDGMLQEIVRTREILFGQDILAFGGPPGIINSGDIFFLLAADADNEIVVRATPISEPSLFLLLALVAAAIAWRRYG